MTSTENFVVEQALAELSARGDAGNAIHDGAGRIRLFFHGTRAPDDFTTFSCDGPPLDDDGFPLSEDSGPDPTAFLGAHIAEERKVL